MKNSLVKHLTVAIVVAAIVGCVAGVVANWQLALLASWGVFVLLLIALIIKDFARDTPDETAKAARADAMSNPAIDGIVIAASLAA